ncbi:MAG: sialidase family protein [Pseudomonadota bacterium]
MCHWKMLAFTLFLVLHALQLCAEPSDAPLVLKSAVHFEDFQNREPMVLELSNGDLLVSGFPRAPHEPARPPSLWRSSDGGNSWARVNVGTPADGAVGNSDVDLALGPDGTIYFVTMGFNRTTSRGTHVAVGVSNDDGASWAWTQLTDRELADRPWVVVSGDGTAHVVWNDGDGVHHTLSRDGGKTWQSRPQVHSSGGSSHLAVGPQGELAVRLTPLYASGNRFDAQVDMIAVSTDGGDTWSKRALPGSRVWLPGGVPRWVEPIAWDGDGALYYLWSEGRSMHLGRSTDRGAAWESWQIATDSDVMFYPYLIATADRELAATWFSAADGRGLRVAKVSLKEGEPQVSSSELLRFESWAETEDGRQRDSNGEYAPIVRLADGDLAVVTPLQDARLERLGFSFWRLETSPR